MNEEEKKAIHLLQSYAGMTHKLTDNQGRPKLDQAIEKVLNLIEKQQKQIEQDNNIISDLQNEVTLKDSEIEKKNKIIDLMAEVLTDCEFDDKCQECNFECERDYDQLFQCNKEYFTKKAEK